MLCVTLILIAIISCGAREISLTNGTEEFHINAMSLAESTPGTGSRIIGGSPTTIENFPFAAQVLLNGHLTCGGSLLTARHVLSAAHCFVQQSTGILSSPSSFSIRAGSTNLYQGGTVRTVSTIVVHPSYDRFTHDNDVAVLVLTSSLQIGTSIAQGVIPNQGDNLADNSTVVAVGWGRNSLVVETISSVLLQVSIRTINRAVCRQRYEWLGTLTNSYLPITDNMLCAGLLDVGGADSCQGDSGGPLVFNGIIVGVTSWGYRCADATFPGVYAQVSRYTTWINQTVTRFSGNGASSSQTGIIAILVPLVFLMLSL